MKSDLKVIVATVYGEAASQSSASWRAVAFSIINRYGFREWRGKSYSKICKEGYDAAKDNTGLYSRAMREMNSGKMSSVVKKIYDVVKPIYDGTDIDDTGRTTFYYSPKAQAALHKTNPAKYPSVLPWILRGGRDKLFERVYIDGTESDDFAWYRYKGDGSTLKVKVENLDDQSKSENKIKATIRNGSNAFTKEYTAGSDGSVPHIHARKGSLVTFEVNDLECQKKLTADGKPKKVTLQSVNCTFKSTTEVHKGKPSPSSQQNKTNSTNQSGSSDNKSQGDTAGAQEKTQVVKFSIKLVEEDTGKVLPNAKYYLGYKENVKAHQSDSSGVESDVSAETGNTIEVLLDDDGNTKQTIGDFEVTSKLNGTTKTVKVPVVNLTVTLKDSKGSVLKLKKCFCHYRGKKSEKRTNANGVVKIKALAGQKITFTDEAGRPLFTNIVTYGKELWTYTETKASSSSSHSSQTNSKSDNKDKKPQGSAAKPKVTAKDKRDADGHPETKVASDNVRFVIRFYDKDKKTPLSGFSYTLTSKKYGSNSRITTKDGTRGRAHESLEHQNITLTYMDGDKQVTKKFTVKRGMGELKYYAEKPTYEKGIVTFNIYHDGRIIKYIPKVINSRDKFKYVYYDSKGGKHTICIVKWNTTKEKSKGILRYTKPTHSKVSYDKNVSEGSTKRRIKYVNGDIAEYGRHPTKGNIWRLYKAGKNNITLVRMPDSLNYNSNGIKVAYNFTSTRRRYTSPGHLACFIGALAAVGVTMRTGGSCFKEGSSFPSTAHNNGRSIDTSYLSNKTKEQRFISAMKKFGCTRQIQGRYMKYKDAIPDKKTSGLHDSHLHSEFNEAKVKVVYES